MCGACKTNHNVRGAARRNLHFSLVQVGLNELQKVLTLCATQGTARIGVGTFESADGLEIYEDSFRAIVPKRASVR